MAAELFKSYFYERKKAQIIKQRSLRFHSFVSRLRFRKKKLQNGRGKNSKWPQDCLKVIFRGEKRIRSKNKNHFVSTALWVDKDSTKKFKMATGKIKNGHLIV